MSERSDNVVRLGCAEQAAIADELRRYWQHVVDEGVPEQLRGLVERFGADGHDTVAGAAADEPGQDAAQSGIIVLADFRGGDCEKPT
jgi:anti-sigma factor NepR-like protein